MRRAPAAARALLLLLLCSCGRAGVAGDEDDEVVLVEDVAEEEPSRHRQSDRDSDRGEAAKGKGRKSKLHERASAAKAKARAARMTPAEAFREAADFLSVAAADMAKEGYADGYVDGEIVHDRATSMDEGLIPFSTHWGQVQSRHRLAGSSANAAADYEAGDRVVAQNAGLRELISRQVDRHRSLMRSTLEILPVEKKTRSLRMYMEARLKASSTSGLKKQLSSLDNVKEMLTAQRDHRAGRLLGLGSRELGMLALNSFVSAGVLAAARLLLHHLGVSIGGGLKLDLLQCSAPTAVAAGMVIKEAGPEHFAVQNFVCVALLCLLLSAGIFAAWLPFRLSMVPRRRAVSEEEEQGMEEETRQCPDGRWHTRSEWEDKGYSEKDWEDAGPGDDSGGDEK